MRRADNGLRPELIKRLRPLGFELTPIETGSVTSGVPDCTWGHAARRSTGWIECKATDGWAVKFRPHQLGWLARRAALGDRVAVAVRVGGVGSANGAGDGLWLAHGAGAALMAEHGLDGLLRMAPEHVAGRWYGHPRTWDWHAVAVALLG